MLNLPSKFKSSLGNGRVTSLFPLVVIGSNVRLSIKSVNIDGKSYDPLLLSSPSIKSSADIINNKYTISSVSLSISNAIYQNKMFSDSLPSLLNETTKIYYCANCYINKFHRVHKKLQFQPLDNSTKSINKG